MVRKMSWHKPHDSPTTQTLSPPTSLRVIWVHIREVGGSSPSPPTKYTIVSRTRDRTDKTMRLDDALDGYWPGQLFETLCRNLSRNTKCFRNRVNHTATPLNHGIVIKQKRRCIFLSVQPCRVYEIRMDGLSSQHWPQSRSDAGRTLLCRRAEQ